MSDSVGHLRLSRRQFLRYGAASGLMLLGGLGLVQAGGRQESGQYQGQILGPSSTLGHRIRDGGVPQPHTTRRVGVMIIGGGISGLSAAWWLQKHHAQDVLLVEMEQEVGGNARHGSNAISAYPWGAHYVPLPGPEATYVRALFEELNVITGYDRSGRPIYNDYYLCHDPAERLLMNGRWQDGLVPQTDLSEKDRSQIEAFLTFVEDLKRAKGGDGKPAFTIPLELSSCDQRFRQYDGFTMAEFLARHRWDSPALKWYVNYCCRDDYGATADQVSAWAGLHYFASRSGQAANAESHTVLTWPQGNGWLADQLRTRVASKIKTQQLVTNIEQETDAVAVDVFDPSLNHTTRYLAQAVICAVPRFVAAKLMRNMREKPPAYLGAFSYAPWMVANVSLVNAPGGKGAPLSWDNVSYHSRSLGYIVATHQHLALFRTKTVLTYYLPLTEADPSTERKRAAARSYDEWATIVAQDLSRMHPDIEKEIENIDIWIWGHGMIRPAPGFIWGEARREALKPVGRVHFAHSDMSGVSIFEEAQYRGVEAAQAVLKQIKHS